MAWHGWREPLDFSCEECGEDVVAYKGEDAVCRFCGHVHLYEPTDLDYEDYRRHREPEGDTW